MDLKRAYLDRGEMNVERLGRGYAWLDTGTLESLQDAGAFIRTTETRTGIKVCCTEEVAFQAHWIDTETLLRRAALLGRTGYATYLRRLVEEDGQGPRGSH